MAEKVSMSVAAAVALDGLGRLFTAMHRATKYQARTSPSPSGLYPATVLMTADGQIAVGQDGQPIVTFPPMTVMEVDGSTVKFSHPEQHVSIGTLAALSSLDVSTIYRKIDSGELPKTVQLSSKRVAFKWQDVTAWLASRKAG